MPCIEHTWSQRLRLSARSDGGRASGLLGSHVETGYAGLPRRATVNHPVVDRRHDTRFLPPLLHLTRATLRPGHPVSLVDLSAGGALIQCARPLRPGARVHLQVATDARTVSLNGHVLRCAVWAVDAHAGVTYRGAVKFEHRCELLWERGTLHGSAVPGASRPPAAGFGKGLPAESGRHHPAHRKHLK